MAKDYLFEITYMTNNDYETSFHYAVDDKEIVQGIEENRNGWHASDGNGKGNREGIAIEICYSLSGGERFISGIMDYYSSWRHFIRAF